MNIRRNIVIIKEINVIIVITGDKIIVFVYFIRLKQLCHFMFEQGIVPRLILHCGF